MNLLRISQYLQRFVSVYLTTIPGQYQEKKLQILQKLYIEMVKFLNDSGEEYWLDFGTLLGYHREKGIIAHDIDIDFSMHEKSYASVISRAGILPKGFRLYDTSSRHHGPKLYINYKGFDCDIYFFEDLGETLRSYENTQFSNERQMIPKGLIYPLEEANFINTKVFVPAQTRLYLEYIYGDIGRNAKRNRVTGFWEKQ